MYNARASVYTLVKCANFAAIHSKHFNASAMKDVFENVDAQNVIDFLKEIQFYRELILLFLFYIIQILLVLILNIVKVFQLVYTTCF